jgi:lauroyl/myristoyl acyltransferase
MANSKEGAAEKRSMPDVEPDDHWPVERQIVRGDQNGIFAKVQYGAYRLSMALFARMPKFAMNGFARVFGMLGKRLDRKHANAARGYLRQALNEHAGLGLSERELERRVNVAYEHLFHVAVDTGRFDRRFGAECSWEQLLERADVEVEPEARAAMERGCIVVSGHFGDWEMCARFASAVGFRPMYAISKPPRNYPLSVEFQRLRESWGMRLLPRRGAMKFAAEVIEGRGILGMLLDQRARKRPVMVPFFGRDARCDRSAGVLLRRLRCPVVFIACYKQPEDLRWRFFAGHVIHPEDVTGRSPEQITAMVNTKLEELILEEPEQNFWLHDRYRGA